MFVRLLYEANILCNCIIKERYVTSSGAMLKKRHVNKQEDDFSSVLQ